MSFLAPLFLVGAAAIGAPIIYHLIRRTTRERVVFSSLMFLAPSPPRLSKRHRLEHLLLLALRCVALGLLALGFARPFLRQAPPIDPLATQPRRVLVLVDTSASMRREGLWAAAREKAEAVLRRTGAADHVALYTFDRTAHEIFSFDEWNRTVPSDRIAAATARLAAMAPGWSGTHLGTAVITAAEALAETDGKTTPGPREIVLVSDLQAGSRLDTLQAYEWPKGVKLFVEPVKARNLTNAGVQLVGDSPDASHAADAAVRVRVMNSPESKREQFKVGWAQASAPTEFAGTPLDIYVPPGQSRVIPIPVPKTGAAAVERVILRGDDESFDNTVYVIPPRQEHLAILWLGNDAPDDTKQPLFFLRRALSDTPKVAVQVTERKAAEALLPADVAAANVIFVGDSLPAAQASVVRDEVSAGKLAFIVMRNAAMGETVGALLGRQSVPASEAKPTNYAMFGDIDFQHPLFAPFADPRFSDFTKIHIWRHRKLDAAGVPSARAIVKFDNGDPALLEVPLGRGKVYILTAGWQPEDSQLAVSSKFVPFVWSLIELGGGAAAAPLQYFVGDKLLAPAATSTLRRPDGSTAVLTASKAADLNEPGIYEFAGTAPGSKPQRFAVNLDPNESRTAALGADELERLGVPVAARAAPETVASAQTKQMLQAAEAENRQKLWRWFIAATLAVLLVETALAGWTARRASEQAEEAAS